MLYAIISPHLEQPWCYVEFQQPPTLEEMADHLAELGGFADRDEWAAANRNPFIGFAQVH
ncbi:beta-lactoglobulin I [Paraburkholderia sp.]|uniref:beta-lactoglobulin I n=1 Tax=Paraburkholderia sp. TaxID=1926495 RepID=UPI0039E6539B